jgi:DNA-binding Lrp family transcriptional regulator
MSEHEIILQKIDQLMQEVKALREQNNPAQDTSMLDLNQMADELKCSPSGFRNRILPSLLRNGVVKKYGGRYKARRCDFELYKLNQ